MCEYHVRVSRALSYCSIVRGFDSGKRDIRFSVFDFYCLDRLLGNSRVQENCVGPDKPNADDAWQTPQQCDGEKVNRPGTEDNIDAHLKKIGYLNRVK